MTARLKKRSYKKASVVEQDAAFVYLDDAALHTPHGNIVSHPSRALCERLAREWNAQTKYVDPSLMPLTRIVNSALDQVRDNRGRIVDEVVAFANADLIFHEAEGPEALVAQQRSAWQPLRDWAARELDAHLLVASGIMAVAQPQSSIRAVRRAVERHDDVGLAALHISTGMCGSVVIGLALSGGRVSGEEAWALSRIDEAWQIENWGEDTDAETAAKIAEADVLACAAVFRLSRLD